MTKRVTMLVAVLVLVVSGISCKGNSDILDEGDIDKYNLTITLESEYSHDNESYLYPREEFEVKLRSDGKEIELDNNETVIWTVMQTTGGNYFFTYGAPEVQLMSVDEDFTSEGTYKIRADIYDAKEYKVLGAVAPRLGTDELDIIVEAIDFEIETEVVREGVIKFKPWILNPEIGPVYTMLSLNFGDNTQDYVEGRNPDSITHEYVKEGTYQITAELKYTVDYKDKYGPTTLAKTNTSVEVGSTFSILAPSELYKTNIEYKFQALTTSKLPDEPSYEWDFSDGTKKVIPYSNEVIHSFDKPGKHVIYVEVFDSEEEAANVLGTAYLTIIVEESPNHLVELHQMKKFALDFAVQHNYVEGMSGVFLWDWDSFGEVVWDGINFSMEWSQYSHFERMTGRVSEDGTSIEQLKIRHEFIDSQGQTTWHELEIQNLPFWEDTMPDRFLVEVDDKDVEKYVTYFNSYRTAGYQWNDEARLFVRFLPE